MESARDQIEFVKYSEVCKAGHIVMKSEATVFHGFNTHLMLIA